MTTPYMPTQNAEAFRLQQSALGTALALQASRASSNWLQDLNDVYRGFWALVDQLIALTTNARGISYQQALQYYELSRELAQVAGSPPEVSEPEFPTSAFIASMIWTGPRYAEALVKAGKTEQINEVVSNSVGRAVMKHSLNAGRTTLVQAARRDNEAFGWARITDADPCDFCSMLASRGAVYKNNKTAGELNKWHDGCACSVIPVFQE